MGAGDYSMRIWLDPAAMRIRYLSPADVYQAIQSQNVEVSAGNVGQPIGTDNKNAYQYSLTVKGRLTSPEEFGNIILRTFVLVCSHSLPPSLFSFGFFAASAEAYF